MGRKKAPQDKILTYLSKPLKGEWTSADKLSSKIREPLDVVERVICEMTEAGIVEGVKDKADGQYYVRNPWQAP